jgi:TRAP-type C4-dicarboxylate transport system permease small subunit
MAIWYLILAIICGLVFIFSAISLIKNIKKKRSGHNSTTKGEHEHKGPL